MGEENIRIEADTKPAQEELASLTAEFERSMDAARDMEHGLGDAARALDDMEESAEAAAAAAKKVAPAASGGARGLKLFGDGALDSGKKLGKATDTLGKLTQSVTLATPALGSFGGQMSGAAGLANALGGALGPVGIAITAVTAAVGLFMKAQQEAEEETRKLNEAMDKQALAAVDLERQMRLTADAQRALVRELTSHIDASNSFVDQNKRVLAINDEIQQAEAFRAQVLLPELARAQREISVAAEASARADVRAADRDIAALREKLEEARARQEAFAARESQEADEDARAETEKLAAARKAAHDAEMRRRDAFLKSLTGAGDETEAQIEREIRNELRKEQVLLEIAETERRLHNEAYERGEARAQQDRENQALAQSILADLEAQAEQTRARMEQASVELQALGGQAMELWGSMEGIRDQVQQGELTAAEGRKLMFAEFLKQFAREMALRGLENLAAVPASYPDVAKMAQKGLAAGLYFAAAGAAGAGGKKLASNAGASQAARQDRDGGNSGRSPRASTSGGSGGGNVTINIHSPFASRGEAGQAIEQAVRANARLTRGSGGNQ